MVLAKAQHDAKLAPLRLSIIPPPDIQLPPALVSHSVERPSQTSTTSAAGKLNRTRGTGHAVRCHPTLLKARKTLNDVNLSLPTALLGDRGMWLSLVVDEVEFDLAGEGVKVSLSDGVQHSWDWSQLENAPFGQAESDEPRVELGRLIGLAEEGFVATDPLSPTPPMAQTRPQLLARLQQLTTQLRQAVDDLVLSSVLDSRAPHISTEADFATLVNLAADPSLDLPLGWQASHQSSAAPAQPTVISSKLSKLTFLGSKADREPSPLAKSTLPIEESDDLADEEAGRFRGQLESRRRLGSVADSLESTEAVDKPSQPSRAQSDLLRTIELLSSIRKEMLNIFSVRLIGLLKARIGAPTYSIWAATGAVKWCKQLARQKGAQVSRLILQLLDDTDGDQFDRSEDDDDELAEEAGRMEVEDEGEWAGFGGFGGFFTTVDSKPKGQSQTQAERVERRRRRNIFYHMRDDYDLRMWCQKASSRIILGWDANEIDSSDEESGPHWVRPLPPWEVSKPYPRLGRGQPRLAGTLRLPKDDKAHRRAKDHAATSQGQTSPEGKFSISNALTPPSSPTTSPPTSDEESDATDTSDEAEDEGMRMKGRVGSDETFEVEDPLGLELLPKRLPRALVRLGAAGREMAQMRHKLHSTCNQIAGLQSKIIELERFVKAQSDEWDKTRREERTPKPPDAVLRSKSSATAPLPPALQPLRLSAADRTVSQSINASLKQNGQKAAPSFSLVVPSPSTGAKRAARAPPLLPPRKRQKQNVDAIAGVMAAQRAEADRAARAGAGQARGSPPTRGKARSPERGLGKGGRLSPKRTLSWPDGTVSAPKPAAAGARTVGTGPAGGLLPPPQISAGLRAALANSPGMLFAGLGIGRPKSPRSNNGVGLGLLEKGDDAFPKLASCSYAGPSAAGAGAAAPVPWVELSRPNEDGKDDEVHDIEVGPEAMEVDEPDGSVPRRGGPQPGALVGGKTESNGGKSGGGVGLGASAPDSPQIEQGEWGRPSGEHLRGRVVAEDAFGALDLDSWLGQGAGDWTAEDLGAAVPAVGGRPASPHPNKSPTRGLFRPASEAMAKGLPPSPRRSSSSFPKSFGGYGMSTLPLTPPWDAGGLPAALPALQQPDAFPTSKERGGRPRSPPLVSLPPLSEVIGLPAKPSGERKGDGERTPVLESEAMPLLPPPVGLVAPRPRRGEGTSAFRAGPGRPAWLSLEERFAPAGGATQESASASGGAARLSPERLGMLRARSVSPRVEGEVGWVEPGEGGGAVGMEVEGDDGLKADLVPKYVGTAVGGGEVAREEQAAEGAKVVVATAHAGEAVAPEARDTTPPAGSIPPTASAAMVDESKCSMELASRLGPLAEGGQAGAQVAQAARPDDGPHTPPTSPPAMEEDS